MVWWILFLIGWYLFVSWVARAHSIIWFFRNHRLTKSASSLQHLSNWPLALGKILKHSGFRQDMLLGDDLIKVKWQTGVKGFIKGLHR